MLFIQDALEREYAYAKSFELPVVNIRRNKPHLLAGLHAAYGLNPGFSLPQAATAVRQIRSQTIQRVYDLARFGLRLPVRGLILDPRYFDTDRLHAGFRACVRCRPEGLIYPPRLQRQFFRACYSCHFCPACWARVVAAQYSSVYSALQKLTASNSVVTAFIAHADRVFDLSDVLPDEYTPPAVFSAAVSSLSNKLAVLKKDVKRDTRRFQSHRPTRKNALVRGSCWHIVPVPVPGGVRLEYRRLFICAGSIKPKLNPPPRYESRWSRIVVSPRAIHTATTDVLCSFSQYPQQYLTEDLDLVGVCLNVAGGQRLLSGQGALGKIGLVPTSKL